MKKNNKINKIIILSIIALIFIVSLIIFILNYTKDSSSFSILEKNWISNHDDKVIDISVYNDVPIYGQDGEGIIFSFLEQFTNSYGIEFNKISYLTSSNTSMRKSAFKIVDYGDTLTKNDILLYKDYYVLVGKTGENIASIDDLTDKSIAVFDKDINNIRYFLNDGKNIKFVTCKDFSEMLTYLNDKEIDYMAVPNNLYMDKILTNDLKIVYHISELYKKYVLTISDDNTFKSIMNKYNMIFQDNYNDELYKKYFLNTFFKHKKISEVEKMGYNSSSYVFGYTTIMPYQGTVNKEFVGVLSNYLSNFEDIAKVDFKMVEYKSLSELKQALSHGDIDLAFNNFSLFGINADTLVTNGLFNQEYYVLSNEPFVVNSVRSLKGQDIYTVGSTYLYDYLKANGINTITFDNTDMLLRNISNDNVIAVDKDTYEYYKDNKFKAYKIIYEGVLDNSYNFVIRDVNKNKTFYELFNYYVSTINYKAIKYKYNTSYIVNSKNEFSTMLKYVLTIIVVTLLFIAGLALFIRIRSKKQELKKDDKLKFIDVMTSLKNRNYLNYNISAWDENVIYPQAIVMIDLNNIKYINDNYGHTEGDEVIKKAASILINNQLENTDIIRTDGNEFMIYMVGYDEKKVIEFTRKISKELKELPHEFGSAIGYSMITDDIKTIDDAINEATLSMRQAKEKL